VVTAETTFGRSRDSTRRELQELIHRLERRAPRAPLATPLAPPATPRRDLAAALGVARRATEAGPCGYRELRLAPDALAGRQPIAPLFALDAGVLAFLAPDEDLAAATPPDLLFLDIETTGLGGAGAMTFLVATGRVEDDAFVLRQYLALAPEEEGALLAALVEDARPEERPVLVTYNGRGFDAPMLDGRMTMHRRRGGFEALRHLDLLPVARTLYRGLLGSCRLAAVEAELLGITRPDDEVSGADVPGWYFRFLRTRDARCLEPVIRHNEVDVVALAGLLARLGDLTARGAQPAHAGEALALARLFARRGHVDAAVARFELALATLPRSAAREDALLRLAALYKRGGRRADAEPLWRELAGRPGPARLHAQVELAKYYEHDRRDYAGAAAAVDAAVAAIDRAHPSAYLDRRRAALTHRGERLARKRARAAVSSAAGGAGVAR
jgi:uncharacterized protein